MVKLRIITDVPQTTTNKNDQTIQIIPTIIVPNNELRSTRKQNSCNVVSNASEQDVISILKEFDCVKDVWKDRYNSKFDIYYTLKDEDVIRGLQIKSINRVTSRIDEYEINDLDKYIDGMLIVCVNKLINIGFAYVDSNYYRTMQTKISLKRDPINKFEKLILEWDDFILKLKDTLCYGLIVTPELYKNSMSPNHFLEHQSIERFNLFCIKYGLKCELNYDNSSPTDLFVDGFKIQMKYSSKPIGQITGTYSYDINLHRNGSIKYKKGDNDFYVIEIGGYHNDFIWLSENLLIAKGYISENIKTDEISTCNMHIFPPDYIEKKLLITADKYKSQIKGNWSCDKKYWISTEKGCLNDIPDVKSHINNLFSEIFIASNKLKIICSNEEISNPICVVEPIIQKTQLKVKQYDMKGNYIKTFDDISAAAIEVKISNKCISRACKGISDYSAGFKWKYVTNEEIDIEASTKTLKLSTNDKRKVNQYNLDGSYIKTFNSISDAAKIENLKTYQISNMCNQKSNNTGKFIWKFSDSCTNHIDNINIEENKRQSHRTKQVDQFDLDGTFIKRFQSLGEAAFELKILASGISSACTGRFNTYKKFIWRHVNSSV